MRKTAGAHAQATMLLCAVLAAVPRAGTRELGEAGTVASAAQDEQPVMRPRPPVVLPRPIIGPPEAPPHYCPRRVETVTTAARLSALLHDQGFAGTILIPSNTEIVLDGYTELPVRSCVTIEGTRYGLEPGALLAWNSEPEVEVDYAAMFHVSGQYVRIAGLRFQGPRTTDDRSEWWDDWHRCSTSPGGWCRSRKKILGAIRIGDQASSVQIDNNSFRFWTRGVEARRFEPAMKVEEASLVSVTRNSFDRNAVEGDGYGVAAMRGYVLIEGNLFNKNRHAVAASWESKGYIARYNYVLEGGFTECWPCYWNQHFDVHGEHGGYGGRAGVYFEIAYNTIRGEQTYGLGTTRPAFLLRGKPDREARFHHNVVAHDNEAETVRLKKPGDQCLERVPGEMGLPRPANEKCNLFVGPNSYDTDTTDQLAVGDFDGDGRDDVFLANGTGWWYSSAGLTEWRFLRPSSWPVGDLRFGDFDGDGRTDVLSREGPSWWVSSGGTDQPRAVRSDGTRLSDCVFGDFIDNGDGVTDALRADGATWSVSVGGSGQWSIKPGSPRLAAAKLRVGDFNGDGIDDVFWIENGLWSVWYPNWDAVGQDVTKPTSGIAMDSLVIADFDGDGLADLGQTDGDGWRWLRGGTSSWARLRGSGGQSEYKDIRSALLGRFTPEGRLDAIRYAIPRFAEESESGFVLWDGTGDAFAPWSPPWQEMR